MAEPAFLTAVAEAVQEITKCPVCLKTIRPPISKCVNGHIACKECIKTQQQCPKCKTGYFSKNTEQEVKLLTALPKLCCYSKEGCKEWIRNELHELCCEYRPASCRQTECKLEMPLNKLVEHYKLKHREHLVIGERKKEMSGTYNMAALNDDHTLVYISNMKSYSWLIFRKDIERNIIEVSFLDIWEIDSSEHFIVKFKIGDGHRFEYTYCFPHMTTEALEDNIKKIKNVDTEGEIYMMLPIEVLKEIADKNGILKYTIKVV